MTTKSWFGSIGGFDDDFKVSNMIELSIVSNYTVINVHHVWISVPGHVEEK